MDHRLRAIADYFLSCRSASDVDPVAIKPALLPHLFILEIVREPPLWLRIRLVGTAIDAAFQRPLKGHHLETFMHGPRGHEVIAAFHRCANGQEPIWMRQVIQLPDQSPRFVEGIAVYLPPERIYGALVMGDLPPDSRAAAFDWRSLR